MAERSDDLSIVSDDWDRFGEVLDLYYDVLYREFGIAREADWFDAASGGEFVVALGEDGMLLGSARLMPRPGDPSRQLRQVAVVPECRGRGLGGALVRELERIADDEGAEGVWLNARRTAYGFYERLGYEPVDSEFVSALTGIPHRLMKKPLR